MTPSLVTLSTNSRDESASVTYVGWYRASRFELGRSPRGATYKITFAVDDQEGQRVREMDIVLVDDLLTLSF